MDSDKTKLFIHTLDISNDIFPLEWFVLNKYVSKLEIEIYKNLLSDESQNVERCTTIYINSKWIEGSLSHWLYIYKYSKKNAPSQSFGQHIIFLESKIIEMIRIWFRQHYEIHIFTANR